MPISLFTQDILDHRSSTRPSPRSKPRRREGSEVGSPRGLSNHVTVAPFERDAFRGRPLELMGPPRVTPAALKGGCHGQRTRQRRGGQGQRRREGRRRQDDGRQGIAGRREEGQGEGRGPPGPPPPPRPPPGPPPTKGRQSTKGERGAPRAPLFARHA